MCTKTKKLTENDIGSMTTAKNEVFMGVLWGYESCYLEEGINL